MPRYQPMQSSSRNCTQYICSRWKTLFSVALVAAIAYHNGKRSNSNGSSSVLEPTPCPESSPVIATSKEDSLGPLNLVLEEHVQRYWNDGDPQVGAGYAKECRVSICPDKLLPTVFFAACHIAVRTPADLCTGVNLSEAWSEAYGANYITYLNQLPLY
eukprot:11494-Heterococcus_DN1.PRE.1